jgi:hypothetical protein
MHLVLLRRPTRKIMHAPGCIPLHLQLSRAKRPLLPNQDVEVIVGGMQARMSLRT